MTMPLIATMSTKTGHIKNSRKKQHSKNFPSRNIIDQTDYLEPLENNLFAKSYLNRNKSRI
jgi:hypothetical protein